MHILIIIGISAIVSAFITYSIAVITEQIKKKINNVVLVFITLGVTFDILATTFMVSASTDTIFTLHGNIGFTALFAMMLNTYLIWKNYLKSGQNISRSIHRYSLIAYLFWVLSFVSGGMHMMTLAR